MREKYHQTLPNNFFFFFYNKQEKLFNNVIRFKNKEDRLKKLINGLKIKLNAKLKNLKGLKG